MAPTQTFVIDNGGSTIKAGFATAPAPRVVPNCLARDRHKKVYVASELDGCQDFGDVQFRRPVDKGFIVNWEAQKHIWDHEFFGQEAGQGCDPMESRLVLTEPPNALPALRGHCDQIVFEAYQFSSYYRGICPTFNAYHDLQPIFQTSQQTPGLTKLPVEIMLVVDCGYSHTTVTPLLTGRPIHRAVRRLDVGGKVMTNYLARLLSLRHFDMRSDIYVVNDIKESACFVSEDFSADLERCWKGTRQERREEYAAAGGIARDYILPDFHMRTKGVLADYDPSRHAKARGRTTGSRTDPSDEDLLTLRNERFAVPEVLFKPFIIGLGQPGLADVVMQSLSVVPVGLWPGLFQNILVVGGCAKIPGLVAQLRDEIRRRAPDECLVRVASQPDPISTTWMGAAALARHEHIERLAVTRQFYEEHGGARVAHVFATGAGVP